MQKPLQEYIRGLYGGYTSEATRKVGGGGMDFSNVPISANPLDLALRLSKTDAMLPKPTSALPDYVDPTALQAIRAMLNVPLMGGGMGAEIKMPSNGQDNIIPKQASTPSEMIAQVRENQLKNAQTALPETTETAKPAVSASKQTPANLRNIWSQINALSMSIPDAKRRHAFVATEIERMKADGEIDEKTATTLHNWNTSINASQEEKGIDERLLWLLMIASMFQR